MTHIAALKRYSAPIFTKCDYNLASLLLAVTEFERVRLWIERKIRSPSSFTLCVISWRFFAKYTHALYRGNVVYYIFRCICAGVVVLWLSLSSRYILKKKKQKHIGNIEFYIELSAGWRIYIRRAWDYLFSIYMRWDSLAHVADRVYMFCDYPGLGGVGCLVEPKSRKHDTIKK